MPTKLCQRHSLPFALLCTFLLGMTGAGAASDFTYFKDQELNYWNAGPGSSGAKPTSGADRNTPKAPASIGASTFPWRKYLDPKNDEFFKEGDYSPPAPFMEIARDPSDSNIENWFHYLEMKNQLLHRLQDRLTAYASNHPQSLPAGIAPMPAEMARAADQAPPLMKAAAEKMSPGPNPAPDAKRFRMRLYFDSHCPHCEHMLATTIRDLSSMGYWIELKQTDRDESARARIPFPVSSATAEELRRYQIESVPVLLVGNLKTKSFFKMQGFQPTRAVVEGLQKSR